MNHFKVFCLLPMMLMLLFQPAFAQSLENRLTKRNFADPPHSAGLHVWWHWMEGNITREGITKDLEAMKEQGIVQATIYNVGFFGPFNPGIAKVKFGSDEWYAMFRWALQEANRLGITIGSPDADGWNSGGPWITPEMSMKQFVFTKTIIQGGKKISQKLKQPYAVQGFYKDIAVVAYKTNESLNSFQAANPEIILNNGTNGAVLIDGDPVSTVNIKKGDYIQISLNNSFNFDKIAIYPRKPFSFIDVDTYRSKYSVSVSDDGKDFVKIKDFAVKGIRDMNYITLPQTKAKFVRLTLDSLDKNDEDWIPFKIAELELLKDNEMATCNPEIPYILEKTNSINSAREEYLYKKTTPDPEMLKSGDVVILNDKFADNGTLNWDVPEGKWTILRFGFTSTGRRNEPATNEGKGLECDRMDSSAIDLHFNNFAQKLINNARAIGDTAFKFMLFDSWEAGYQNWTANFGSEFEKKRGYSILPYIPLLCGKAMNSPEESEAVLYDFRKTIAELIESGYYGRFSELCHKNNLKFYAEVLYGGSDGPPLDIMKANSLVDVPMGEFWADGTFSPSKPSSSLISSVATGYNKPVIAAEAYTRRADFSESPASLKPFGDKMYCTGFNRFTFHDYALQPDDRKPGFTLSQYGSNINRNNLYWPYLGGWLDYQSRIQYILQQGTTAADVLYYIGDQLPQYYSPEKNILPFGYALTVINYDILKNRINVKNGKLLLNNEGNYSLLCLPEFTYMNYETLERIGQLVQEGIVVLGPRPTNLLNLNDVKNNRQAFKELADKIWGNIDGKTIFENNFGKGKVFWGIPVEEAIKKINLLPDFTTSLPENNTFQFTHKKIGELDAYFVANQLNVPVNSECLFRVGEQTPEVWQPENGSVKKPAAFNIENGNVRIPVHFKPYESKFFVFSKGLPNVYINKILENGQQVFPALSQIKESAPEVYFDQNKVNLIPSTTTNYVFSTNTNKTFTKQLLQPEEIAITDFNGTMQFEPAYKASIEPVNITKLKSLTEFENPDIRYFAGNITYTITFDVPPSISSSKDSLLLNIGDFGVVAEVWLNGNPLGKLWKPFTDQNIGGMLKNKNELVVKVANVYRNRFIGDFIQFGKVRNLWTTAPIETILDKDKPLLPLGLIGPVKLIRIKKQYISF